MTTLPDIFDTNLTEVATVPTETDEQCGVRIYHDGRRFVLACVERMEAFAVADDAYVAATLTAGYLAGYGNLSGELVDPGGSDRVQDWSATVAQARDILDDPGLLVQEIWDGKASAEQ